MTSTENQLIEKFKQDMSLQCGKMVEVKILDKWDELCHFDSSVKFWTLAQMILDATGWDAQMTFTKKHLTRNAEEEVSRRRIVDLIATCNGMGVTHIGRETGRNHSTIINSVTTSKDLVETNVIYRKFIREIMQFIRENYHLYRDKEYDRDSVLNQYK